MIDHIDYPEKEYKHYVACTPVQVALALQSASFMDYSSFMKNTLDLFLQGTK